MYMLSCCLEGLGAPLDYSIPAVDFSAEQPRNSDFGSCGTRQVASEFGFPAELEDPKGLTQVDTTASPEDSTFVTEPCQPVPDVSTEQAVQGGTADEPRDGEGATTSVPQVHEEANKQDIVDGPPGVQYQGSYKNGKRNGFGILIRPCGSRFEGYFVDDAANGTGTFYHPSGDVYSGQWRDNKAHGEGRFTHADGSSYEGQWVSDVQEGYGIEKWIDGSSYEGYYVAGKKNGEGRFKWPNGSTFEGQFKNNEICGEGTYRWTDGKSYTGQWVQNRMQGQGRMVLSDGSVHEGMYFQDRKHGRGRITWPDGHYFEGEWEAGKKVPGVGRYFDAQGRDLGSLEDIQQMTNGTGGLCGKTTTASSKSSLSPRVRETEISQQGRTKIDRVALKGELGSPSQQRVQTTLSKGTVESTGTANATEERRHGAGDARVAQHRVGESARKKSSKRNVAHDSSSAQDGASQQASLSHHNLVKGNTGSTEVTSGDTNARGSFAVNAKKQDPVCSSAADYAKGDHMRRYDDERHLRGPTGGVPGQDQDPAGTETKNSRSTGGTSRGDERRNRKRAFEGFFSRRK